MIELDIPGFGLLRLDHLVLDYNGTLAQDGALLAGVGAGLRALSEALAVHVVTADTFGRARSALAGQPGRVTVLPPGAQDQAKLAYVRQLGAAHICAIGNGRNDRLMLQAAALGICVLQAEGAAVAAITAADVICRDIVEALDLLRRPRRLTATLRSG